MKLNRREFVAATAAFAAEAARALPSAQSPRIGHRQANMVTAPGQNIFEMAKSIRGLDGVELQMIWKGADLSQPGSPAAMYRQQAADNGVLVPSIAGVWKQGESIFVPDAARTALANSVKTAAFFGARVILVAMYGDKCPNMADEHSFGPAVTIFQEAAARASDAGVTLGLETSLAPAEDKKLVDLIGRPSVRTYYDIANVETYHPGEGVGGIRILGEHIVQCHIKDETGSLQPGSGHVNWPGALAAYKAIRYPGWFVFETKHTSPEACRTQTEANIAFIRSRMA